MSIRLSEDEAWEVLAASHTGILTTLRADGCPVALPMWFVVLGRTICVRTPARTKKVTRIRRDPRASFLVESGERWAELQAVHLTGRVDQVDDPDLQQRIDEALDQKYAAYRTARGDMPASAQARYADFAYLRFMPEPGLLTWDNARLRR